MPDRIFSIQADGTLVPLDSHDYSSEDLLQKLLARYPDLLAGHQMDPDAPRRWLLIGREFLIPDEEGGTLRWALDHLFVDQDGTPTLIEVKRSTDGRLRREAIGQMLDYAANLSSFVPVDEMQRVFLARCAADKLDPSSEIARLLDVPPDGADQVLWQRVRTKMQAGAIRLIFVADQIPRELKRVVEFLNIQMDPVEVIAVEIRQYVGGSLQTLVPVVIGLPTDRRLPPPPRDTEQTFFTAIAERQGKAITDVALALKTWVTSLVSEISWGRGSMIPVLALGGGRDRGGVNYYYFVVRTNGKIEMQFGNLKGKPGFETPEPLQEFVASINAIPGVALPVDAFNRFPSFDIASLRHPDSLTAFKTAVQRAVERSKTAWANRSVENGPA